MLTKSDDGRSLASDAPIAVAIPCLNEAAAIGNLVRTWRQVLPEAEIFVFDNNSSDATAEEAGKAGARVESVLKPGKGEVVQVIFQSLKDRPAVILTDGDGTYPPELAVELLAPVLAGSAEMSVGRRCPVEVEGSPGMAPIRWLGNHILRFTFRTLIGRGPGDFLSGYRVFSRRMLHEVQPCSGGFEIETELAGEAVGRGYRVVEIDVPYYPRTAGTESKLRAGRDGLRILKCMLELTMRHRPLRLVVPGFLGVVILGYFLRLWMNG